LKNTNATLPLNFRGKNKRRLTTPASLPQRAGLSRQKTMKLDKIIDECLCWLRGEIAGSPGVYLIAIASLARSERQLRIAAKAVVKASKGTDEAAMDAAIEQLKKALK